MKCAVPVSLLTVIGFSLIVFSPGLLLATPATVTMVEEVARTQLTVQDEIERKILEKRGITEYQKHTIADTRELNDGKTGEVLAYVIELEPEGYIVITPDTDLTPVLAYSLNCDFTFTNSPRNILLDLVIRDMSNRLALLPDYPTDLIEENNRCWVDYRAGDPQFLDKMTCRAIHGPLLSSAWHQTSPYNAYCPLDSGTRSYVGCAATAMGQVINYHQYPASVTFTSADSYTSPAIGVVINAPTASISSITYPPSNDMAARISFACGVSIKMNYTATESGANVVYPASALTNKFGYSSANFIYFDGEDDDARGIEFYGRMHSDILNNRPNLLNLFASGRDGHTVVCDGWNSSATTLFHLNMGWGGSWDNWYSLPTVTCSYNFDTVHSGVVDIVPGGAPPPTSDFRVLAGGDYNGDGRSDIAIFRASSGLWSIRGGNRYYFGQAGDIPVPGDYRGDGRSEIAIFRPSTGLWAYRTASGAVGRLYFGTNGDTPVPADYTGNGTVNVAIFRPSTGLWAINGLPRYYFGQSGDYPIPSDYTSGGDGLADIGIFRGSTGLWALRSGARAYFGRSGDIPVPGDYDGDGDREAAIFRPSNGLWAVFDSGARYYFGSSSDQPVVANYYVNHLDHVAIFRASTGLWAVRNGFRVYYGKAGDIPVAR